MAGKARSRFKQGLFQIQNKDKYKGTTPIIYRSSYELKFMRWADANPNVVQWGSESIIIPYHNPLTGRVHRYFVDFNITIKQNDSTLKKFLVEIKPDIQTRPPIAKRHCKGLLRKQAEYVKNKAKWIAAEAFAKKHNSEFHVITEKHLNIK
jgi:hypothetical protein